MNAFACMLPNQGLFQPPMKTWLEHVAQEQDCKMGELCLCHEVKDGVERWWWEKRKQEVKSDHPKMKEANWPYNPHSDEGYLQVLADGDIPIQPKITLD